MARLMRGALYLTAARTPYRRGGLAFPAGMPLTVAIASLAVLQLRQLIDDPLISILVGQDDGRFVRVAELDAATDALLQAFIDAAPLVEVEAASAEPDGRPSDLQLELDDVRQALADVNGQLSSVQGEIVSLRQANSTLAQERDDKAAELATSHADTAKLLATIADLQADLARAKKPVAKPKAD